MTACPSPVFLLSDGIRGHLFQGRGVAGWLSRFTGADVVEMDVPRPTGWERIRIFKWKARFLPSMDGDGAACWLEEAGASSLLDRAEQELALRKCGENSALFLSAGSGAAPFTLALARATGQKCCTLMPLFPSTIIRKKERTSFPPSGRRTPSSPTNSSGKDGSLPRNIRPGKRAGRRTGGESS